MGILHNDNDDWLQVLEQKQQKQRKRRRQVLFQKILLLALVFVTIGAAAYVTIETGKIRIPFLTDKQTGQAGDIQGQERLAAPGMRMSQTALRIQVQIQLIHRHPIRRYPTQTAAPIAKTLVCQPDPGRRRQMMQLAHWRAQVRRFISIRKIQESWETGS